MIQFNIVFTWLNSATAPVSWPLFEGKVQET